MGPRLKTASGTVVLSVLIAAILLAGGPGGGGGEPTPTPTGTATATPTPTATPGNGTANLWVNASGCDSTPTRSSTAQTYANISVGAVGCSFQQVAAAANSGDTIRVRAGTYGPQGSLSNGGKTLTFIGDDGAEVDTGTGSGTYDHFSLDGNTTACNIDVTGQFPLVSIYGDGNVLCDMEIYPEAGTIRRYASNEPLLIEDGCSGQSTGDCAADNPTGADYTITNNVVRNVQIGVTNSFRGCRDGDTGNGCPSGDNMHLELVRVGGGVDTLTLDRLTLGPCPNGPGGNGGYVGCGSGQVFLTSCTNPLCAPPKNITIRNSVFMDPIVNYHMQWNSIIGTGNQNFLMAYNTFGDGEVVAQGSNVGGVQWTGNAGMRPQNCTTGGTFTKNVWAWDTGTACGTDTRVGSAQSMTALMVDGDYKPQVGSPLINGGQATSCSASGGVDREGTARPIGSTCDAGAFEVG